jgi:hypothetical protein
MPCSVRKRSGCQGCKSDRFARDGQCQYRLDEFICVRKRFCFQETCVGSGSDKSGGCGDKERCEEEGKEEVLGVNRGTM